MAAKEQAGTSPNLLKEMCLTHTVDRHRRLVELLEVIVVGDTAKLVLEYFPCSLMVTWSRTCRLFEWDLCYKYGRDMLQAVWLMHSKGAALATYP